MYYLMRLTSGSICIKKDYKKYGPILLKFVCYHPTPFIRPMRDEILASSEELEDIMTEAVFFAL